MDKGVHTIHSVVVASGNRKKEAGSEPDSRRKCSRDGCLILIFLGPKLSIHMYACYTTELEPYPSLSYSFLPPARGRAGKG